MSCRDWQASIIERFIDGRMKSISSTIRISSTIQMIPKQFFTHGPQPEPAIKAALMLLVSVPFLIPTHHQPIPSFYGEWWAFLFGSLAMLAATLIRPLHIAIPETTAIPGLLLFLSGAQWALGMVPTREAILMHSGYLLWSAMLLILGATLTLRFGTRWLFQILATGLLCGALLSALLGLAQLLDIPLPAYLMFPWFMPEIHAGIYANLGQSNLLGSYLWIGIAATIYLRTHDLLSYRSSVLASIALGFVAGLTLSRMSIMYGLAMLAIGLAGRLTQSFPHSKIREQLIVIALISLTFGGVVLHQWSHLSHRVAGVTLLDRYSPKSVGSDPRLDIWRDTVKIIGDHPWVGNGIGNYTWRMLESTAEAPPGAKTLPNAEHSHNALLQIAADYGLPTLILCLILFARWLYRIRFSSPTGESNHLGIDILVVLGIYSMLEYPLWYSFYLGLATLLIGALGVNAKTAAFTGSRKLLGFGIAAAILALVPLRLDYGTLDIATNFPLSHQPSDAEWKKRIEMIAQVANHSSIGSYAYLALAVMSVPERSISHDQSQVCEAAMKIWPIPLVVTRCAILREFEGYPREAEQLLKLLGKAYREKGQRLEVGTVLNQVEKKDPEVKRLRVFWDTAVM